MHKRGILIVVVLLLVGFLSLAINSDNVSAATTGGCCFSNTDCPEDNYCKWPSTCILAGSCAPLDCPYYLSYSQNECNFNNQCGDGNDCKSTTVSGTYAKANQCQTLTLSANKCEPCAYPSADCTADGQGGCYNNLASDAKNCGICGKTCAPDEICNAGICKEFIPLCIDNDGDGYFANAQACLAGAAKQDCDDSNKFAYQYLNGYADKDGDGYGAGDVQKVCSGASLYSGYVSVGGDCDDGNSNIKPGAVEVLNLKDDNCNNLVDEGLCGNNVCDSGELVTCSNDCVKCGNGINEFGEVCDYMVSGDKKAVSCGDYGSVSVGCKSDCSGYESPVCGSCRDGKVQSPPEECEPGQTRSYTCPDGSLAPLPQTCELTGANACKWKPVTTCPVSSSVSFCFDGDKNGNELGVDCGGSCQTSAAESCNNADDDKDCQVDEGFNLNTDANNCGLCGKKCVAGESCVSGSCVKPAGPCGNGAIDPGEYCDGSNLNGQTCVSLGGYMGGTLSCIPPGEPGECLYDYTKCTLMPADACTGANLDTSKGCCLVDGSQWLKSGEWGQSAAAASAVGKTNQMCGGFSGLSSISLPANAVQLVQSLNSYGSSASIMSDGMLQISGYYTTPALWGSLKVYKITGTVNPATGATQVSTQYMSYQYGSVGPLPQPSSSTTSDGAASFWKGCDSWSADSCYYRLTYGGPTVEGVSMPLYGTTIAGVRVFGTAAGNFVVYSYMSGGFAYLKVAKITFKAEQRYGIYGCGDEDNCYGSYTVMKPVAEITTLYQGGVGQTGAINNFDAYVAANKIFIVPKVFDPYGVWHSVFWFDTVTGEQGSTALPKRSFMPGPLKLFVIGNNVYALWADSADNLMLASVDASKPLSMTSFSGGAQMVGALTNDISYATGGAAYSLAANDEALYVVYTTDNTILKTAPPPSAYVAYAKQICASAEKPDSMFRAAKRLPSAGTSFCLDNEPGFLRTRQCVAGICASDPTDSAVCDKASDCVYKGVCYSDIKDVASTFFGGKQDSLMASSWKGEVSEAVMAGGGTGLCDPGQWTGPVGALSGSVRNSTSGLQGASVDAVGTSNPSLTYSATTLNDGTYAIAGIEPANYDVTASKTGYTSKTENNVPIQPYQTATVNFQLENAPVTAVVSGVVTNVSAMPVQGAVVRILGTAFSATTAADGTYSIAGVPFGTYDVVASKPSDGYVDASALGAELSSGSVSVDLVLTRLSGGCNDDCTKADGFCHAECGGKGLCSFSSAETATACDSAVPGIITDPSDSSRQIMCCTGASYTPVKANVKISCGDNVVSIRTPVLFRGRVVNMVITTFRAGECEP